MDLATHSIFVSRDVHFHETIFPFQSDLFSQHIDPFHSISPLVIPIPTPTDSIPLPIEPSPFQSRPLDTCVTDVVSAQPAASSDPIPTPVLDSHIPG